MVRTLFATVALAASVSVCAHGAASAQEMRMLLSWSATYPIVEVTGVFAENVKKATGGKFNIAMQGPEAVPPFEQLQPVSAGVFDFLFTHPAYHAGTTSLALGLEASDPDSDKRREVGAWDALDTHYQKHGLKLISLPVSGKEGFIMLLRKPIGEDGGLKGRKIRAAPLHLPIVSEFGASAVVLPTNDIYSALEKGVVDGATWPVFGPLQYRWYEVSSYFTQPSYGVVTHQILMNLDKWKKLPKETQQILLDEGRKLETYSFKEFSDRAEKELAALKEKGMKPTDFGPAQKAKLGELWASGVWGLAEKQNGEEAKALHALLKKAKMTY